MDERYNLNDLKAWRYKKVVKTSADDVFKVYELSKKERMKCFMFKKNFF